MHQPAFDYMKVKGALRQTIISCYRGRHADPDIYKNTLDCFSAVLDAKILGKDLESWINDVEKTRHTQKTLQNEVGNIHTKVLGTISGWHDMGVGKILDLENSDKKIVAELKNKHNTTKGNHKKDIYDDLAEVIDSRPGYTGYYVEILPKNLQRYDHPFSPPDNAKQGTKRPERPDIRIIDGYSFYALVTGSATALLEFYEMFPSIIGDVLEEEFPSYRDRPLGDYSLHLFKKIFK